MRKLATIVRSVASAGVLVLLCATCESGHGNQAGHSVPGGDVDRGRKLISAYGCGTCHVVPGIRGAHGMVGPSLDHFERHTIVAGMFPNKLEPLMSWIMFPQTGIPGNAMPDMHVSTEDARDIAAYLYTLH